MTVQRVLQFETLAQNNEDVRKINRVVRGVMDGKTNNAGFVTLDTGSAVTTTLENERIGYDSVVMLSPTTANALSRNAYVSATTRGSATISHAANTYADCIFGYIIVG